MSKARCQLMENILNNPHWKDEIIAELCINDCKKCPYNTISEKDKMYDILMKIYDRLEEKRLKKAKLEFMNYVMNIAREKTNRKLEEMNILDFTRLLQEKEHYQEEFKEAIVIFEDNLFELMEKIIYDTMKALKEA